LEGFAGQFAASDQISHILLISRPGS
jgi:hypothetical protein